MSTSAPSATYPNGQIRKLSNEAGEHGDLEMVAICDRAQSGAYSARAELAK